MNKWLLRFSQVLGLLLLLVTLTSALVPASTTNERKTSLALRQIGHDYLAGCGDSTSRIPAVAETADGNLLLRLEQEIDYDTIARIARAVMASYGIRQDYTLALEDCTSGEIFLGSFWNADEGLLPGNSAACTGRDQEARCANLSITFHGEARAEVPLGSWLLGGLGVLLLFAGPLTRRSTESPAEAPVPVSALDSLKKPLQLTPACSFDATTQLLRVGATEHQLTYREGQLLAYLAARPNEILQRQNIHDAVWGVDGIITGRSLDVFVSRLRKKLAVDEGLEIKTVHGVGYQFLVRAGVGAA
jgi:hypothetical protein